MLSILFRIIFTISLCLRFVLMANKAFPIAFPKKRSSLVASEITKVR